MKAERKAQRAADVRGEKAARRAARTKGGHARRSAAHYLRCVNAAEDVTNELIRLGSPNRGAKWLSLERESAAVRGFRQ